MLNLPSFRRKPSGCAVVVPDGDSVRFALGRSAAEGKPWILSYGEKPIDRHRGSLAAALKGFGVRGMKDGATLLAAGEYHFLALDAPEVQEAELKAAMKWRLKDIVDFPIEEASFDLMAIPGAPGAASRSRSTFVVVAKKETLRRRIANFDAARFGLTVIDIPETAQRNIATLYEEDGRGVGLLYFDATGGLMTISFGGELYHARRFEMTQVNIAEASGESRAELFSRILLEVQRTLDNFERQFSFVALTKVLVGPEAEDTGMVAFLRSNLALSVEAVALENVLEFVPGAVPGKREQWRFFHLFGCAIRNGAAAR